MVIAGIIFLVLFSVILHEVSHGLVALWNGDSTAKNLGRLTLNPVPHIDPIGTIALPIVLFLIHSPVLFAWAKPVPYNPAYFKNKEWGLFSVSLAGPLMNFLLAFLFSLGLKGGVNYDPYFSSRIQDPMQVVFFYAVSINVILGIFNLIPIPPLDGSKVLGSALPKRVRVAYFSLERYGFIIIFALLMTGALQKILIPLFLAVFEFITGMRI